MTSIRTRITSAVVGCTALVVAVAALLVGTTARAMLVNGLDDRLRGRARWFTTVFRAPPGMNGGDSREGRGGGERGSRDERGDRDGRDGRDGRDDRDSRALPAELEPQQPPPQHLYEVRDDQSGEEIQRSPALPEGVSLAALGVKKGDPIRTIRLPDGRPFRVIAIESQVRTWGFGREFSRGRDGTREPAREADAARDGDAGTTPPSPSPPAPRERPLATTWVALDATEMERESERLAWTLAAVWAGATVLAFAVSIKLSRAVLSPVASLSRTIEEMTPGNLSSRVPMEEVPAELSSVVSRLNALFEKVEAAFQRERATIANMAHELRNPLSALRATLEFGLFQPLSPPQRKTLESSLSLAVRMQALVNGLLTLTRIEAGQEVLERQEIDVVRVLRDAWATVEPRARERGLASAWDVPESLVVVSSRMHVELVAANLLDNAVSHGEPGPVSIELASEPNRVRLRVSNACADPETRTGFFEPFFRSDPARSSARHFGLGLALCDRVVRLLGGSIDARQEGRRFTVTVDLPAPTPASRTPAAAA